MLVPPDNFGVVEEGIYRCSKLESDHFPFLETLKLKSLIVLDAEKPPRLLKTFIESNNIELYNLGGLKISNHYHTGANSSLGKDDDDGDDVSSIHSNRRISSSNTNEIELINIGDTTTGGSNGDSDKKKNDQWMLIEKNLILRAFELLLNKNRHNLLLVDSTSTLVGILRKIQKWNFNSIVNEYRIYTGAPSKSNYYAENFLELIQPELIPFEIEQLNKRQQEQSNVNNNISNGNRPSISTSPRNIGIPSPRNETLRDSSMGNYFGHQISYEPTFIELDDDVDVDEDDELTDDDLLSASPQIPANLLKLVEKRKNEKANRSNSNESEDMDKLGSGSSASGGRRRITPGSSPKLHSSLKRNSITNEMFFSTALGGRRRSSVDAKLRPINSTNNTKFRSGSNIGIGSFSEATLPSSFPGVRRLSKGKNDPTYANFENLSLQEIQNIREKYDFKFYKNLHKYTIKYENVNVIKIKLPPDEKLPSWFIKNRDFWESSFRKMNHIV
ncbi:hypothetical protein CLIB1423_14S01354 [[Candida] railenensis]|uniref:Protein OCA4 n=1 Tax=[Candida] railenensis TaxID=45579 RepID=A0A9P0QSE9_9ASCO|nr:hypothetical protein CLIB1423_14S01354 [[Candida] railenensis]